MSEHHCNHSHHQEQYFSSLQSTHEGATIVNVGEVIQNHDEGHHCNSPSSSNTTPAATSAPNSSWVHRKNHPAMSPVNETVVNLAVYNNTFNFFSFPEPQAADSKKNAPYRRCNCWNCAKLLKKRWVITILITLVVILVAVGGFVYSVKPNKLKFTINDLSIQGFSNTANLDLSPLSLSDYTTSCNITMKVRNPNKLFRIYHDGGSVISVRHRNRELFHGAAPSFFQNPGNETTLKISLKNDSSSSGNIGLLKRMQDSKELADGMIPLDVRFGARATFKFSSVSVNATIWADCRLIVNALAVDSKILSQHCPVTLDFAQHFKL